MTTFGDEPPQVQVSTTRWVRNDATFFFWNAFDVATTGLLGAAARQSVALAFDGGTNISWYGYRVDACEWQAVTPGAAGTTGACHTLKSNNSGPTDRVSSITVDVTPTQAMLNHGGVVIRLDLVGAGGPFLTEWVPFARPALALSPASVSEGGGVSTVTATLSGASTGAVTLTVAAAAVPPAVAGDFTLSATNTLTIAAGATSTGTVTVTAVDNNVDAPDKTVTVSATVGGAVVSALTLALPDDEALPKAALVLTPPSVTENGGVSTVTATLSHPSSEAVTVTVSASPGVGAVATDFTLSTATTLTIAPGVTTSAGLVTVTAVDNAVSAADKTVTVSATATGGRGVAAPPGVALTLRDDELGLTEGAVSGLATEAGGQATFTVALLTQPTAAVTVAVSSRDTTEGTVAPSSLTFSTGDWSTAQTVTVTGVQDPVDDGDVTWNVRLDPASGDTGYGGLSDVDVPVTTTDDDGPPGVALALDPSSIAESGAGNVATVTARLSHPSGAATTVAVAAASGVFTVGAGAAGVVVVAAGATTSTDTATVTAVDDDTDAPDRTATVTATVTNDRATADSDDDGGDGGGADGARRRRGSDRGAGAGPGVGVGERRPLDGDGDLVASVERALDGDGGGGGRGLHGGRGRDHHHRGGGDHGGLGYGGGDGSGRRHPPGDYEPQRDGDGGAGQRPGGGDGERGGADAGPTTRRCRWRVWLSRRPRFRRTAASPR